MVLDQGYEFADGVLLTERWVRFIFHVGQGFMVEVDVVF